jgi:DNA-binding MarR family transcriptional regulator
MVYRRSPEAVLGMSLKSFAILSHLREVDSTSQQALGDMLCVDANTLVLLLNELEAAGHATRERDPADRRRHIVQITPAGRVALRTGEHGMDSVEDEIFGALSGEERATLRGLLAKTLEGMPSVAESTRADSALATSAART